MCGPDGRVLHQGQNTEEMIPIEIDMERVERSRKMGLLRLGQPLKSFRDHMGDFTIYRPGEKHEYLESLGPLIKPKRVDELAKLTMKDDLTP